MTPFRTFTGVAAPILQDNIDTDQIIPSREMKRVAKDGLADGLFAGWRFHYEGDAKVAPDPRFVLNQPAYRGTTILLSGSNFGCGSSREHAVWALRDFGVRVVIAQSFGRIFRSNCARNGLLAVQLTAAEIERIHAAVVADPQREKISVDLEHSRILLPDGSHIMFAIEEFDRGMLLAGLDYVDYTLQFSADIEAFSARDRERRPWAYL